MTASETKRRTKPNRRSPAAIWNSPTRTTSDERAAILLPGGTAASSSPATTESAAVVETFMNTELVKIAATGTATINV